MTIELSDEDCPDCGHHLQVIYATELKQVVSGWACPDCGFLKSETEQCTDSIEKPQHEEYVLRIEKSLSSDDVTDPFGDVVDEFHSRASDQMDSDEVWFLIDPETEELVDIRAGEDVESKPS